MASRPWHRWQVVAVPLEGEFSRILAESWNTEYGKSHMPFTVTRWGARSFVAHQERAWGGSLGFEVRRIR